MDKSNMSSLRLLVSLACIIYLGNKIVLAAPPIPNMDVKVLYAWKYMDYDFGCLQERNEAINSGRYNYTTNFPIDVDRWGDMTFVTVIRDKGVPSTLNVVSKKQGRGGPILEPYPNWNWTKTDCTGIVSVYRVAIDSCDRLWVLDTGIINDEVVCPAQLLSFDLHAHTLLERVTIPKDVAENATSGKGLLTTPVVQTFGINCQRTNVFMTDTLGYAVLVYDGKSIRRLTSSAFNDDPRYVTYTINGESFQLDDGPVGMAVSQLTQKVYLSPMSSHNMVSVKSETLVQAKSGPVEVKEYKDVLSTQSSAKAMSRTGALFMGLVNNTAIACWHEFNDLTKDNILMIAQNSVTLQFISGMKTYVLQRWPGTEKLLLLSNRYQKIARNTVNFQEVNFRILEADVGHLIHNTICTPSYV